MRQGFRSAEEVQRFSDMMEEMCYIVATKHSGSLKVRIASCAYTWHCINVISAQEWWSLSNDDIGSCSLLCVSWQEDFRMCFARSIASLGPEISAKRMLNLVCQVGRVMGGLVENLSHCVSCPASVTMEWGFIAVV